MYRNYFKRVLDIIVSFGAILVGIPIFFLVAIVIYLQDGGSPFFTQKRVGYAEKDFTLVKFRSMPVNTKNVPSTQTDKIRITPFGKFIRRSNLDELPQLLNILRGDISLIGPRPSLRNQTELVELRRSLNVYSAKPGLTGLAQVNAFDGMTDVQKSDWDGEYVKKITFSKDLKIIMRTFVYLTKKPPVY